MPASKLNRPPFAIQEPEQMTLPHIEPAQVPAFTENAVSSTQAQQPQQAATVSFDCATVSGIHRDLFEKELSSKTSWGRNQIISIFDQTAAQAAFHVMQQMIQAKEEV